MTTSSPGRRGGRPGVRAGSGNVQPVTEGHSVRQRRAPTYRRLFGRSEFSGLFAARVLSDWGDYLARVAISALVLDRSGSALFAASVFAISFLPQVFGQALLGPVADRLPRRTLLVVCDLLRAGLIVLLVVAVMRQTPLPVLLLLLFLVELVGSPFFAAGQALLTEVFDDRPTFLRASSLMQVSMQVNQVLGVAIGGLLVAAVGADRVLWLDAVSFGLSGLLLALFVHARAAAVEGGVPGLRTLVLDVREGVRYLRGDVPLRWLIGLALLMLLAMIAPEAVALPLAEEQGADTSVGGVLLAAVPLGTAVGIYVVSRWEPTTQVRRMLPMAACVPLPLLGMALEPPWPVAAGLFALAGFFQGFMVPLMGTFTVLAPEHMRGRLNGVAGAGFALVSATCFLGVGALADVTTSAFAIVVAAALTLVLVAVAWPRWPRQAIDAAAGDVYS